MIRTFQFRLDPNAAQTAVLEHILIDNCETYNAALQERRDAWKMERKTITYRNQQDELSELRKNILFRFIACNIQRDPLRRVDIAFKGFFARCKAGEKPGYPRFKSRQQYNSFSFNEPICHDKSIKIPNLGYIRVRGGRAIEGTAKLCMIKRIGNKWVASVACDIGSAPEKITISHTTGIDVGLTILATLSDGTEIANPRWIKQYEKRIANANRSLSRKKRGSKNRLKSKEILRRAYQRAANARANYLHHVSKWLVENYDLIAYEDLKIKNMVRSNLAKSIFDAAWGQLIYQLTYKAESAGRWVVAVNPHGTSQKCSSCRALVKKDLSERMHSCICGLILGRDHNAAINIKQLALSSLGMSDVVVQAEFIQTSNTELCI